MRKGRLLQQMVLGKVDSHMKKNESGPLSDTIKWIKDLNIDLKPSTPRRKHRQQAP